MDSNLIQWIIFFTIMNTLVICHGFLEPAVLHDYCFDKVFQHNCGEGVLLINDAFYGRMKLGTCITEDFGRIGCKSDVTAIINQECFSKTACEISVRDNRLIATKPCGELTGYLEVKHTCLPVISGPKRRCDSGDLLKITSPSKGYISSFTSRDTGCGGRTSPWLIESSDGKSIQIRLLDLTYTAAASSSQSEICLVYALIKEPSRGRSETVCGGQSKLRVVYRSLGNTVEVTIVSKERQFVLEYEFVGCANMPSKAGMTYIRDGDVTNVECDNNGERSEFRCDGTNWTGEQPNCTTVEAEDKGLIALVSETRLPPSERNVDILTSRKENDNGKSVRFNFESITWGMVLIVIGIITAGIVACVFIIGVVYLKRKSIECKGPILVPRPVSEAGYEVCDFDISQCTSSVYRDGYLTVPKDYTPMMNGTLPKYKKPDVWERPLPAEPNHV